MGKRGQDQAESLIIYAIYINIRFLNALPFPSKYSYSDTWVLYFYKVKSLI